MTVKSALSLSPLPSFPFLQNPLFLLNRAIPCFPVLTGAHSPHIPYFPPQPLLIFFSSFGNVESSVKIPSSFLLLLLLSPPSCEIAVVSYGFLFLRDGRWVHVGVEATKHAVSAQRAGQHTQWASCGYDSCHVHISALPIIKNMHAVKIKSHSVITAEWFMF